MGADNKRRVLYVFDTDVIVAHCAPWRSGPADDVFLGRGYGQVLPQKPYESYPPGRRQAALFEERRRAEAVCWLLADKALRNALEHQPILQMGPHFAETLRVYEAVKLDAKSEPAYVRSTAEARQDHILNQTLQFIRINVQSEKWPLEINPGHFLSNVLSRMQVRDLQRTSPFVREWDGFLDLVRRGGGIFELTEFRPRDASMTEHQAEAWTKICSRLKRQRNSPEWNNLYPVFQAIVAPDRYQRSRDRLEVDTETLTDLALANKWLSETEDSLRIVFVTGDRKMVLALAAARDILRGSEGEMASRFAFDHVHHLWSLVDSIGADITLPSRNGGRRSELFSGFLAFDENEQSAAEVDRLARYAIRAEPALTFRLLHQDIEQAYARWDDFSEGAANLHRYFLSGNTEEISEILIEKLKFGDPNWNLEKLRAVVQETMARARDRSNVEFSGIGANSILDAHRHGVRNPPDLMFDSLKVTHRIFKDLALPRRIFLDADDFARRFERIVDDCYQPPLGSTVDDDHRQECYLKYLVLGALFASANRWLVAEQHAESAARIIERAKDLRDPIRTRSPRDELRSHMSGREAYYLLAVSTRVRARDERGFDESERWLREARIRLQEDRKERTGQGVPYIRFDCEALALSLSRYYHARSQSGEPRADRFADAVFRQARAVLNEREAMARRNASTDVPPGDKLDNLPASTRASIATNILQVAAITCFRDRKEYCGNETSPVGRALISDELGTLIDSTSLLAELERVSVEEATGPATASAEIICSPLMMRYAVVAAMMIGDSRIWRPQNLQEVDELFQSREIVVTSYDRWRFDMLRNLARELLSQGG
ncbi:hypothetical protein V5279_43505 [Bradyrhizobium sp. 26S5]|uniref:hypothetical protein n=1 Tax=Bradyrhizobium sp. 26S5 TaxID=3139729 RepID=UPI0030D324D9